MRVLVSLALLPFTVSSFSYIFRSTFYRTATYIYRSKDSPGDDLNPFEIIFPFTHTRTHVYTSLSPERRLREEYRSDELYRWRLWDYLALLSTLWLNWNKRLLFGMVTLFTFSSIMRIGEKLDWNERNIQISSNTVTLFILHNFSKRSDDLNISFYRNMQFKCIIFYNVINYFVSVFNLVFLFIINVFFWLNLRMHKKKKHWKRIIIFFFKYISQRLLYQFLKYNIKQKY